MAYSDFTLATVQQQFQLRIAEQHNLFPDLPPVAVSPILRSTLDETIPLALAIHTEKARSELIIAPLLVEVRRLLDKQISLFSGIDFTIAPEQGLNGVCDYILARSPEQLFLQAPVMMIVEAKNENIKGGLAQCIAAMVAAQRFNEQASNPIAAIGGAVTTGNVWRFLLLADQTVTIDKREYYINRVDEILAVLVYVAGGTIVTTVSN
ncbi:MAG: hypothetical protein HC876_08650 [Chloroflexaceae bacterium]|nr:hypothetical protein [Chloroflexaceae bacterium]NJO05572.1 hypothetical protein [Chloroflexaceae bacterium]